MQLELGSGFQPLWVQIPEFVLACFHAQSLLVWKCSVCLRCRIKCGGAAGRAGKQHTVLVTHPYPAQPPQSHLALGMLRSCCQGPASFPGVAHLVLLAVRSCTSWDCTAALYLQAALLPVFPFSYSRLSPNLLKPVMCLQLLTADLFPACALQFKTVQSELPDPCSLCLFLSHPAQLPSHQAPRSYFQAALISF